MIEKLYPLEGLADSSALLYSGLTASRPAIAMANGDAVVANGQPVCASKSSVLPPELWSQVLQQLDEDDLQHTALALSRAIPLSGVTLKHLFTHLRITRDKIQANQLIRRLGPRYKDADVVKSLVVTFANRAWRWVDFHWLS